MFENVSAYSVCAAIAFVCAFAVILILAIRRKAMGFDFFALCFVTMVGVYFGAHIMYFLVGLPDFIDYLKTGAVFNLATFIDAMFSYASGLVFYGGLLGGLLALFITLRSSHFIDSRAWLNNFVVAFPLFHAIGRIGCTLNGCCYGIEYHGPFAIQYSEEQIRGSVNADIADFPRFPIQPLEAVLEFALFIALLIIYLKTGTKYSITCIYLFCYSIIRFFDEFLRGDAIRGIWGPFSTSQWISIFILIGIAVYLYVTRRKKKAAAVV